MKTFLRLLVLVALLGGAYVYFINPAALEQAKPLVARVTDGSIKETVMAGFGGGKPPEEAPQTVDTPPAPAATPRPLEEIKLKNGQVIVGHVIITDAQMTWVRTPDGKTVELKTRSIESMPKPNR